MDCIFCRIITGKIPGEILYRDDKVIAFCDIHPQSPIHLLIVPTKHIASLAELPDNETSLIGDMIKVANRLAREQGIAGSGYRVVINCGKQGGQIVPHLHMHLMGGRELSGSLG